MTSEYQTVSSSALSSSSVTFRFENGNDGSNSGECIVVFEDFTFSIDTELVDAAASITPGYVYRIFTKNNGTTEGDTKYYLTSTGYLTSDEASAAKFVVSTTAEDKFVPAGYAFKFTQVGGNTRFTNRPNNSPGQVHLNTSTSDRDDYESQVLYKNGTKYAIRSTNYNGDGSQYAQNSYWTVIPDKTDDGLPEASYDDDNATRGTKHYVWQLEELTYITYNLIYNGSTIASVGPLDNSSGTYNGTTALPTDTWNNPYCSYSYSPATITSETRTINVTMTWEGPFTISSDYASATWAYLKLRGKYAKYDKDLTINGSTAYPLYASKDYVRYTDEGLWAFVGNPIQGVRVFNKAAGADKCIQWTSYPQMASTSNGNAVYWEIKKLDGYGFLLYYGGYYIHDNGGNTPGKFGIWSGSGAATDPGSAFVVEDLDWRDKAVFAVRDYGNSHALNEYFGVDETLMNSTITTIKNYAGDFTEEMYNTITSDYSGLIKYPETGYYTLKSKATSKYLSVSGSSIIVMDYGPNCVGFLNKTGDNTYTISYLESSSIHSNGSGYYMSVGDASSFSGSLYNGGVAFTSSGVYLTDQGDGGVTGFTTPYTDYATWTIEDAESVTLTLNSDGAEPANYYATLYLPFDVTITGANAYTLSKSGSYLIPAAVPSNQVPAGTPVLLKGDSDEATATINTGAAFNSGSPLDCVLAGTYTALTSFNGASNYVLGIDNKVVGFYHWDGTTLAANRAYLAGAAVKGYTIRWDDVNEVTSVEAAQPAENAIYNLAGMRLKKLQKGVNLVNGKAIIVK